MKRMWCLMGVLALLMVVAPITAKAETSQKSLSSQEALSVETEIPRAFQGIDLAETLLIDDTQAQEIRGTAWPGALVIAYYIGLYGPNAYEIYDKLDVMWTAGIGIAEIIANFLSFW